MGPAEYVSGTWSQGASPELDLAVTKVLDFIVNGVVPDTAEGASITRASWKNLRVPRSTPWG